MANSRQIALLQDRGVVQVTGADAAKLLDGLVTNDMDRLGRAPALHAGLLSPQGKILFSFFVVKAGSSYLLEVARAQAGDLVKRLTFYKLRAAAQFTDVSADMLVAAVWGDAAPDFPRGILCVPDPRDARLGHRLILPAARRDELGAFVDASDAYDARRVDLGVAELGRDYPAGDTFPHEANFDRQNGVAFDKGCFVGQEVVARMQNKTVVRKRVVKIGGAALVAGATILHGEGVIGTVGTVADRTALALLRLDRAAEADAKSEPLVSSGAVVTVDPAALQDYRDSVRNKPVIDL